MSATLKCSSCDELKPDTEFYPNVEQRKAGRRRGRSYRCKVCLRGISKDQAATLPPDKRRTVRLKHVYNMTTKQYEQLLESQRSVCAICKEPETVRGRRLSVDHCHLTGEVRGLLCLTCNTGLGRFRDDVDLLDAAITYLKGTDATKSNTSHSEAPDGLHPAASHSAPA